MGNPVSVGGAPFRSGRVSQVPVDETKLALTVGCTFGFETPQPVSAVLQVAPWGLSSRSVPSAGTPTPTTMATSTGSATAASGSRSPRARHGSRTRPRSCSPRRATGSHPARARRRSKRYRTPTSRSLDDRGRRLPRRSGRLPRLRAPGDHVLPRAEHPGALRLRLHPRDRRPAARRADGLRRVVRGLPRRRLAHVRRPQQPPPRRPRGRRPRAATPSTSRSITSFGPVTLTEFEVRAA